MDSDHHHECLDCGDTWLCLSECLPLRLTLCARCAERRRQTGPDRSRVIGLPPGVWCGTVARHLMAEHGEAIRRRLRRRGAP